MTRIACNVKGAAALGIAAAICAQAYVRAGRTPNTPYFVGEPAHVKVFVNSQTKAGLQSLSGDTIISADSSPTGAILAALDRWNSISGTTLRFDAPVAVETASPLFDGQSVITFADTPSNRSITGGAIAVARLFSASTGELTDTDIIFNPQYGFSTTLQAETFDIESVLVHELGHAVGMEHSASASSTLFAYGEPASADARSLSADDIAFPRGVYPSPGNSPYGSLTVDTAVFQGSAAGGVVVAAIDPGQNILLTGLSDAAGRAEIRGVPPGNYLLYAEPANGPVVPRNFSPFDVLDSFRTTILGGPDSPVSVSVTPAAETAATLSFQLGLDPLNILGAGGAEAGASIESYSGLVARPGGHYVFEIYGDGLTAVSLSSISFLGSGVSVSGPFERDEVELFEGLTYPLLRFRINVAPTAPAGSLSLMVRVSDELSLFTGALEIAVPTPRPAFLTNAVVNAASFEAGALAPGGIFSIFGENLAPAEGFGFFDPLSGGLIELLRGVSVLIDNRPAPLFYVSPNQINAQAPAELQPGSFAEVRVLREDVISPSRLAPVAAAAPGVFVHPESARIVAINQDGSLNSAANPANRGSVLSLYLTGAGAYSPSLAAGQPAPLPPPLHQVAADVEATIGGQTAAVEFAGASPGFVGLVQLNVRIPATSPAGNAVALRVLAGGAASQAGTTISIR